MQKILSIIFFLGFSFIFYGQETLFLKLEDGNKQPLSEAIIHFLGKHYISDEKGNVTITNLSKGNYPIKITYLGFYDYEGTISIPSKNPYIIVMKEEINQLEGTTVSAIKNGMLPKITTCYTVIKKKQLESKLGDELAKVLTSVSGVSMIQTGATIAKPVIHGLHSNRILILNNDVRQEGQQWGADHAPEIDPSMADLITVVKGANAIRYGSDALGGVVLISPNKLPYGDGLHGRISPSFASNGRKMATSIKIESSVPNLHDWAWRIQGSVKRSGDISTAEYLLNNTAAQEANFSIATGIQKEKGTAEIFYSRYQTENSVFLGAHIGNLDDLLGRFEIGRPLTTYPFSYQINAPKQKVIHHLLKAKAFYLVPFGGKITAQYAFQKDIRQEFNVRRMDRTRIPALNMELSTHSLDVFWENKHNNWNSQIGLSFNQQNNYNQPGTGVVPVIPNYTSYSYGFFGIERYEHNNWLFEAGLRYDFKYLNADGYDMYSQRYGGKHNFHNVTYSIGGFWNENKPFNIKSNIGLAWRAPHVNELYSSGLHHGAGTYDLGDESLKAETGIKWLTSFEYKKNILNFHLDLYLQLIKNYIYDYPTGETQILFSGVYPIFQYTQADAFFRGADFDTKIQLNNNFEYTLKTSIVFANELKTKRYFPFIPAPRFSQSLEYNIYPDNFFESFQASIGHTFVAKQTRFEPSQELVNTTPEAYHLFEASIGGTIKINNTKMLNIRLSSENIFNTLYKEYTNRFRYYAHDLGRNIHLRLNYTF